MSQADVLVIWRAYHNSWGPGMSRKYITLYLDNGLSSWHKVNIWATGEYDCQWELFKIPMKTDTESKYLCKCISFSQTMHIGNVFWSHKNIFVFCNIWCFTVCLISMGWYMKGVTPVHLQWSYAFLVLTHRCSSILLTSAIVQTWITGYL